MTRGPVLWLVPLVLVWGAWNPFMRRVPEVRDANDRLRDRDYPAAEEGYKKALERRASEPRLKHNLGLAFLAQSNFTAAEAEFIAATSSDSEMVRSRGNLFLGITRFHLGELLQQPDEKIKKYREAVDNFRRVLELDPKDEEARHNLEMALERIEDVEKQQEEEKKKQEQQEKDKDQKDKDQKDKDQKDKDQQDKDQQDKDQQDKDQQNKDQQNKDQQDKDQQNKDQQNKDQQDKDQQDKDQQNKDQQDKDQQDKDQQNKDQQNKDQQNKDQQNKDQQNKDQQDQQNQDRPQKESPEAKAARRALDDLKERQKQRIQELHRKGGQGRRAPIKDW